MVVRISKVETASTSVPMDLTLDGHLVLNQPAFPGFPFLGLDREGQMQFTVTVVGRDDAARAHGGLHGSTFFKQQQDLPIDHTQRTESLVSDEFREPEHALVEVNRVFEIFDVKRGFQNAREVWHRYLM